MTLAHPHTQFNCVLDIDIAFFTSLQFNRQQIFNTFVYLSSLAQLCFTPPQFLINSNFPTVPYQHSTFQCNFEVFGLAWPLTAFNIFFGFSGLFDL